MKKISKPIAVFLYVLLVPVVLLGGTVTLFMIQLLLPPFNLLIESFGDFGYSIMLLTAFFVSVFFLLLFFTVRLIKKNHKKQATQNC